MSKKAGIRELKNQTSRIVRREAERTLTDMQSLAAKIGKAWKSPKSALEHLNADRRR